MIWGQGDGSGLRAVDSKVGRIGPLACWEHYNPLARYAMMADAVFYIQRGQVKLTVVSARGKEAVIAILETQAFFGEGCLTGPPRRIATATAFTDCALMRIEKSAMIHVLYAEPAFAALFTAYLLSRNSRIEADLIDQLFNSSEKRLARVFLLLAHFGKEGQTEFVIPKISQETLAEMVGTTQSRVSFFLNKFRRLGFIDYNGGEGRSIAGDIEGLPGLRADASRIVWVLYLATAGFTTGVILAVDGGFVSGKA